MMRLRRSLPILAVAMVVAACGADTSRDAGAGGPVRTVEHVWGTTEVRGAPQRVVALGVTDADPLLALGVTPVAAAAYPFFDGDEVVGPWARDLVEGAGPERIEDDAEVNLEQITALRPDLIVAISSGIDEPTYDRLSQIAPTIARPAGRAAYTATRDETTRMIATALDREARGRELVARANRVVARARAEHPQLVGATGAVVLPFEDVYGAFTPGDTRGRVLRELGLELPPGLAALDEGDSYFIELSRERLDLLEGDALVALVDKGAEATVRDDTVLDQLEVVRRGGLIVDGGDLRAAMTYNSVLSAPFAVRALAPQLARAIDLTGR